MMGPVLSACQAGASRACLMMSELLCGPGPTHQRRGGVLQAGEVRDGRGSARGAKFSRPLALAHGHTAQPSASSQTAQEVVELGPQGK